MTERDRIINERANIIDIIKRWHCAQSRDINGHTIWLIDDTERLADKLIEAGFGNCAALTEKWRALLETQCKKTEEAEHLAKVARRALKIAVSEYSWIKGHENAISTLTYDYLQQAEREIEEEERK